MVDGHILAVGRIQRLGDVVDTADFLGVLIVELDDDLVRQAADGRQDADARGGDDLAVLGDVRSLDDGDVDLTEEAVAQLLSDHREVHVEIRVRPGIDPGAHVLIGLVGRAELDSLGTC